MCGIAGYLDGGGEAADAALLRKMVGMLRHRGPDDCGIFLDGPLGLGHARLSILDLEGGHQPMATADGSLCVTFNGEIFNYLELREELLAKGHQFSTRSDTEVILHAYAEYGEECLRHLNGQWAFAIWDKRRRTLFLARDRVGVRPLFYTTAAGCFVFASEIKSIFAHPAVRREIDPTALAQIFTFWCTLPPRTAFQDVRELPPGHALTLADGRSTLRAYHEFRYQPAAEGSRSEEETAEELRELLVDATRIRLRSDVPVGAYLSGGLDSTLTTALIRNFTHAPLRTFSVAFDDAAFDESGYQQAAINFLQTDHQQVRCSYHDICEVFPEVVWHTEKPILRTAPAPLYILSRLVRDSGYKVVMTGEGADEIFGGYDLFKEAKIRRFWGARPESRLRPLLLKRLYPYLENIQKQPESYLRYFFRVRAEDLHDPFFSHLPRWELTGKLQVFMSAAVRAQQAAEPPYARLRALLPPDFSQWDTFCQAQFLETAYLLPGYILSSQGDRVSMAHSVEGRFPFLDPRVVAFAGKLPVHWKMKVLKEKYLLKRCARGLVPECVVRRCKQPYRAPEAISFFDAEGKPRAEYVGTLLSPQALRASGLFEPAAVQKLVQKVQRRQAIGIKDNMALVGILSTQLLFDRFIQNFEEKASHADG